MYRVILVPLDGSKFTETALPVAASLARKSGAKLHLVHVLDMLRRPEYARDIEPHEWWGGKAMDAANEYLVKVDAEAVWKAGVESTHAVVTGTIDAAILDEAEKKDADLIVMTTHGRPPVQRLWLGSTADRIARTSPIPVLFVHGSEEGAKVSPPAFRKLLVTLDGSEVSETVLPHALEFARVNDSEIRLLYVAEPVRIPATALPTGADATAPFVEALAQRDEAAAGYLDGIAQDLDYPRVTTEVVTSEGPVAEEILDVIERRGVDAVALATHGRGGIRRLVLGSVADKLLRGSNVPVLLCRPHAEASQAEE